MRLDVVIKFGGSAITEKNEFETLKPEELISACKLVKICTEKRLNCVIVHGAGSFGHHHAKKYKVNEGRRSIDPDQTEAINNIKKGMALTRQSVTKLHHYVVSALLDEGIPAMGISSYGLWESHNRVVTRHGVESIMSTIDLGLVPVVHGDVILDTYLGCTILSGDTIIQTICDVCEVEKVAFLTSVDGVYNKPPTDSTDAMLQKAIFVNKDAKIVKTENHLNRMGQVLPSESSSTKEEGIVSGNVCNDVTGGMTLKLKTACNIVSKTQGKTSVFICKLGSSYAMDVCCNGHLPDTESLGTNVQYLDM